MYAHKFLRSLAALSLLVLGGCTPIDNGDSYGQAQQAETLSDGGVDLAPAPRLQPVTLQSGGFTIGVTGTFYDTVLNTNCRPELMADGTTRCVPIAIENARITYVDGACATPALMFALKSCSSQTGKFVVPRKDAPTNLCADTARVPKAVYQIGSKTIMPVLLYTWTSMGCMSTTTSPSFWSDYDIYNITSVSLSSLAEVSEVH